MTDPEGFDDGIFGFHAQQAVEKALKAWLACLGRPYPLRHDLGELLAALEDAGEGVADLWMLTDLTPFAVQLRYDDPDPGSPLDRRAALRDVTTLIARVEEVLSRA